MASIRADLCTPRRVYIQTKFGEPVVSRLKALGATFDGEQKCWWVGAAKHAEVEKILAEPVQAELQGLAAPAEDPDTIRLVGKATYKGRNYYVRVIANSREGDGQRCRLVSLDQKADFWANLAPTGQAPGEKDAVLVKTYAPREVRVGYGGRTRTEYTTLGSIRRFVERQKNPETAQGRCTECDHYGPVGQTCRQCHEGSHV